MVRLNGWNHEHNIKQTMGVVALVGVVVGAAVSIGTTAYQTQQAKKAAEDAKKEQAKIDKQNKLASDKAKRDLADGEAVAKVKDNQEANGGSTGKSRTSIEDLFVSSEEPTNPIVSGTDVIKNPLKV